MEIIKPCKSSFIVKKFGQQVCGKKNLLQFFLAEVATLTVLTVSLVSFWHWHSCSASTTYCPPTILTGPPDINFVGKPMGLGKWQHFQKACVYHDGKLW